MPFDEIHWNSKLLLDLLLKSQSLIKLEVRKSHVAETKGSELWRLSGGRCDWSSEQRYGGRRAGVVSGGEALAAAAKVACDGARAVLHLSDRFSHRYSNYVELVFQCYMLEKVEEKKEQ